MSDEIERLRKEVADLREWHRRDSAPSYAGCARRVTRPAMPSRCACASARRWKESCGG